MAHDHHGAHAHDGHAHGHGHAHDHAHGHHHHHGHHAHAASGNEWRMGLAALLTGGFMLAELAGGILSGSLALIADSGHMLSDFASLVLGWIGFRMARRPADAARTYGFRRFSVVAAFLNGWALVLVAVWIAVEAVRRVLDPHPVLAGPMLWVAAGGLLVNIVAFALLHGADRDNLNIRGALLHVAGDLLGSVAAIAAALIILATGWTLADPLLSVLVAAIIVVAALPLIRDSGHILLEGAPRGLDIAAAVREAREHAPGVADIHHAHAWSIDEDRPMMTLHAQLVPGADPAAAIAAIRRVLVERHGVGHVTIEIETGGCPAPGECA